MRILIVEDEAPLRRCLAKSLTMRSHQVDEVSTRAAAIGILEHVDYGLVLLDVNLPDGTGWDVLRQLAGTKRPPPTVILSAVPPSPRRISVFRPLAVLYKPFPIAGLLQLVSSVADRTADIGDGSTGGSGVVADGQELVRDGDVQG